MNIGIIGARTRNDDCDKAKIQIQLLELLQQHEITNIISGGARKGGDRFAVELANEFRIPIIEYKPKTYTTPHFLARNVEIAKNSNFLIACVDLNFNSIEKIQNSRTGGTNFTVKQFLKLKTGQNLFLV